MSSNLQKKKHLIGLISKIKNPKLRNAVLADFIMKDDVYDAIKEIAVNTINGKLPLTATQKRKIKEKKALFCLAKSSKRNKRKRIVNQLGSGFWGLLIPLVLSLLTAKTSQ